ncbi:alpha/beta fold hydrolase [Saccharospirillum mangrovi]|uniref:alpha/beta fold hydrolase n=1 Tax=Saccharospirillum mangrovi TaxID=2161747 RepID=UPI000D347144|nr:alpha/beta fold hydrolase [Saccharospirillum mangrovi]
MLHSHSLGKGPNLIILHGLFGSGDNWRSVAKALSDRFQVHCLDLPNHGQSPWTEQLNYPSFADAVRDWIDANGIKHTHLIGHSMGGKTAMQLALSGDTDWLQKLVIVDIAPRDYPPHHQDIFAALDAIDLSQFSDRRGVESALMEHGVRDLGIRQFLLKSLYRNDENQLAWRFNLELLKSSYDGIAKAPDFTAPFTGPTLFIKGMNSHYISRDDQPAIEERFPHAQAKLIEGAGHWPHAEKPRAFMRILEGFLPE